MPGTCADQPLAIVIPTYNEVRTIGPLLAALDAVFPEAGVHVVVCDDQSPDGTADVVAAHAAANLRLHLLSAPRSGLGAAYARGFAFAEHTLKAAVVLQMDADLSHRPQDARALYDALVHEPCDFALGSRHLGASHVYDGWPRRRRLLTRGARFLLRQAGLPTTDPTSGFKAIRIHVLARADYPAVAKLYPGYAFQPALLSAIIDANPDLVLRDVPIRFEARAGGASKLNIIDMVQGLLFVARRLPVAYHSFVLYHLVGATGVVVNLGAFALAYNVLNLIPEAASATAFLASLLSNFTINNLLTFPRSRRSLSARLWRYALIALLTLTFHWSLFLLLHNYLLPETLPLLTQAATILLSVPLSLTAWHLNRTWSFQ